MSRIRANTITNKAATGAPTFSNGAVVTGVCTATSLARSGAALTGISTITVADQWRLHTTATGGGSSSNVDLFNWERVDTTPQGYIGTPVTLSNSPTTGVFSFPTTGVYRVSAFAMFSDNGSNMHYARFSMFATSNNLSLIHI